MIKRWWIGPALGVAKLLLAVGVVFGVTACGSDQPEGDGLTLRPSPVVSGVELALWHDQKKTDQVAALQFQTLSAADLQVPTVEPETVFVQNLSDADTFLLKPCGDLESLTGTVVGFTSADVYDLDGKLVGNTCDWPPTARLSREGMVRAEVHVDLVEGLATGDHDVRTVFEAANSASRIVFTSTRDGDAEIYVMNPDGTNQTRLTTSPGDDDHPTWSPDGSKIAFSSYRSGVREVYVMNPDGTNQTRLTTSTGVDRAQAPTWSPDGSKIAFQFHSDLNVDIYVMDADGTNLLRLTDHPGIDAAPAWSPDGTKIAFSSLRRELFDIFSMDADGSNQRNLTQPLSDDLWPSWSPDGGKIVFRSMRDGYPDIFVMNADGSNPTNLTDDTSDDLYQTWSPDGTKIAFQSRRNRGVDIYVMNSDGSNLTRLTTRQGSHPDWSPAFHH